MIHEVKAVVEAKKELDILAGELEDLRGRRQVKSVKSRIEDIKERKAELAQILNDGPAYPISPSEALEAIHGMVDAINDSYQEALSEFQQVLDESDMMYAARWQLRKVILSEATKYFMSHVIKTLDTTEGSDLEIIESVYAAVNQAENVIEQEYVYNTNIFNTSTNPISNLVEVWKHEAAIHLKSDRYGLTVFTLFEELMAGVETWKILQISQNIP